ncbi:MAG TPA: hypothetical protein PK534_08250 [Chitinophagales bacterium]|nr:hypothetical protein [Chitinophagales bacterium]
MKKYQFTLLICIPLLWFFFKLLPMYTHPAETSVTNFMYAENFEALKIWCFDKNSFTRFDDSNNFLYVTILWVFIHFLQFSTVKAALTISAISVFISAYLLHRIIDSRFWSIHLLLVGLLFMSTQIWSGVLGDEILFQGMLWLLVIRSFWKQRYTWILIWGVFNIIARPDNIFMLLPLIIASYWDIRELKERDRKKFIFRRIRRTILFFIIPVAVYFTYRYLYFGKILPYNWLHHSLETDKRYGIFNHQGFYFNVHYLRYYTLPLAIGVAFYFLKEYKHLSIRYYALAFSLLAVPFLYNCTFSQDDNLGFKNQYLLYLGLIILPMLFIRDFRSITQGLATAVFVLFFGIKISFSYFEQTLQSYNNNSYYIANDLAQIHNGKVILYHDNFITWMTEWTATFASGRHTKDGKLMTTQELSASAADIIFTDNKSDIAALKDKYDVYQVPLSTRQYEEDIEPENSLDKFFYKYEHKQPADKNKFYYLLVWRYGNNLKTISKILEQHGAKETSAIQL